jgi:hypothetical protein
MEPVAPAEEPVGEPLSCYLISEQSYGRDGTLKSNVVTGVLWAPENIDLLKTALAYHNGVRDRSDEYGLTRMLVETERMAVLGANAYDDTHFLPDLTVERVPAVAVSEADSKVWVIVMGGAPLLVTSNKEVLGRGFDVVKMLSSKDTSRPHITYLHDIIEVRSGSENGSLICTMHRYNGPILVMRTFTPGVKHFRACWDSHTYDGGLPN